LRRGISVLIGGAFERLFCSEGRAEFEQANHIFKSSNAWEVARGVKLKLQFDWCIKTNQKNVVYA